MNLYLINKDCSESSSIYTCICFSSRFSMKTYFENIIDKRQLYSGGAYVFTACVSCTSNSKIFVDYMQARDYYLSLGGESK